MKHRTRIPFLALALTRAGLSTYGMAAVGDGKASAGSRLLLSAADKADERPLWISVWGGANTLAQALFDVRRERTPDELNRVVAKLRVYSAYGETRPIWTNNQDSRDTVTADNGQTECTDPASIWRWREHFQHDFAARMDWCVADEFRKANHNPIAVLNGDTSGRVLELAVNPGETLKLSAEGTRDPDGNAFEVRWWIYPEASSLRDAKGNRFPDNVALIASRGPASSLVAPPVTKPETIHIILEVEDRGTPSLFAYRRALLTIQP